MKRNRKRIAALVAMALMIVICVCSFAFAEGSKTFIYRDPTDPTSIYTAATGANRPPIVYETNTVNYWAGMPMQQYIWVYAKENETICMGSSQIGSRKIVIEGPFDKDKKLIGTNKGASYTVSATKGYIGTKDEEFYGPKYGKDSNGKGYSPVTYTVPAEGIYKVHFEPENPGTSVTVTNPYFQTTEVSPAEAQAGYYDTSEGRKVPHIYVAAWDVTVYSDAANAANRERQSGRAWIDFYVTHAGNNTTDSQIWGQLYCLTKNNFIYSIQFNGLTSGAGYFFSNSRGIINGDKSFYHSLWDQYDETTHKEQLRPIFYMDGTYNGVKAASEIKDNRTNETIYINAPTNADNPATGDYTHCLFLSYPSPEARKALGIGGSTGTEVQEPKLKGIVFVPTTDLGDNWGAVKAGGTFYINAENIENYSLLVPFSKYNSSLADLEMEGMFTTNAESQLTAADVQKISTATNGKITAVAGDTNWTKIEWDGKDGAGVVVPAGEYGSEDGFEIKFNARTAEIHFPYIDCESNMNGLIIYRTDASGAVIDDTLYYNGDDISGFNYNLSSNPWNAEYDSAYTSKMRENHSVNGLHSTTDHVMIYREAIAEEMTQNRSLTGGNATALDMWTYVKANTKNVDIKYAGIKLKGAPTSFTVGITKAMKGRDAEAGEFEFGMDRVKADGTTEEIRAAVNPAIEAGGKSRVVTFAPITIGDEGSYKFIISERTAKLPKGVKPVGSTQYTLTVVSKYNAATGSYDLTVNDQKIKSDEPIVVDFENEFVPEPEKPDTPGDPNDPKKPGVPDTGDHTNIPALALACGMALAGLIALKKRKF